MKVNLVTFSKKGVRKDFPLSGPSMVIGRKTDADLRIPLSEVSRNHCELVVNGNKAILRDMGSSNGTFVNDQKIVQASLKPGDVIRVGPISLLVQIDNVPARVKPPVPGRPAAPKAAPDAPTEVKATPGFAADEDIDFEELEELDVGDVSDLDIDDLDIGSDEDIEEVGDDAAVPD